jgi:hypothetical protein
VSGKAQRDKFCRQIGASRRDNNELLAVQHVGHRRSGRIAWQRLCRNQLAGRLIVGAEFGVVDLEVRHHFRPALAVGAALLPNDEQRLRQEQMTACGSSKVLEAEMS